MSDLQLLHSAFQKLQFFKELAQDKGVYTVYALLKTLTVQEYRQG